AGRSRPAPAPRTKLNGRNVPYSRSVVTVFITYAAEDPEWPGQRVEALAGKLQQAGATVLLDRWAEQRRRLSDAEWRQWMQLGLRSADHVLCLASTRYNSLSERRSVTPSGRGIAFESHAIKQWLYESKQANDGRVWLYRTAQTPDPAFLLGHC